ncbi:hypothetical protein GCM10027168_27580 [Streptomyces capparidis]
MATGGTGGGFVRLPDRTVIVALHLPHPAGPSWHREGPEGDPPRVRVLVHAANRQRALTRLRNLGFRSVHLRGNTAPPTLDEVSAVLHHPQGLLWRPADAAETVLWRPVSALFRPADRPAGPEGIRP